jgi:hypothetical protein
MPVDSRHSEYERMAPKWQRVRDAVMGEDAIKARKNEYLPLPPGIDKPWGEDDPAYLNYLQRAPFPDIVAPTIRGMVGLMSRKEAQIDLPQGLERLREMATPDGLDLGNLMVRLRHEVLTTGRYILFVDAPEDAGAPFIATYAAESLINWRFDGDRLTMAIFEEFVREPKANDPFVEEQVVQWREASIEREVNEAGEPTGTERYVIRVWRKERGEDGKDRYEVISEVEPRARGEIDRVPAVTVGSRDLLPDPDEIPLLGVVNRALDYYRQVADYRLGLFMSSQATPYVIGATLTDDGGDQIPGIGPSQLWAIQEPNAEVGFLEISGNGLGAQRQALEDTKAEIMDAAMRVLGDGRRGAEAAEALRLRFQSQTATLSSVAQSTAEGLQAALRMLAKWEGADPEQCVVTPSTDFIHEQPDPQTLTAIADIVERGMLPDETLYGYARRVNLTDAEDEELRQMSPQAMALDSGDDEG